MIDAKITHFAFSFCYLTARVVAGVEPVASPEIVTDGANANNNDIIAVLNIDRREEDVFCTIPREKKAFVACRVKKKASSINCGGPR